MRLERLCEENQHLYNSAFALYQSSFPVEERRDEAEQERVMKKQDYHFELIIDGDNCLGVMLYWETDRFIFLEHFTTYPEIRGQGKDAIALSLLKNNGFTLFLQ